MNGASGRELAEYEAMRATIGQRGTVRMVLPVITFIAWAAAALATTAVIGYAAASLVPLLILAAGFEGVYALHLNVERIGRYLQVFHEPHGGWEHVAMEFGRRFPGSGPDPLYSRLFGFAVSVNYVPVALGGELAEIVPLAIVHLFALNRIRVARHAASTQRAEDLDRFKQIKGASLDGS